MILSPSLAESIVPLLKEAQDLSLDGDARTRKVSSKAGNLYSTLIGPMALNTFGMLLEIYENYPHFSPEGGPGAEPGWVDGPEAEEYFRLPDEAFPVSDDAFAILDADTRQTTIRECHKILGILARLAAILRTALDVDDREWQRLDKALSESLAAVEATVERLRGDERGRVS